MILHLVLMSVDNYCTWVLPVEVPQEISQLFGESRDFHINCVTISEAVHQMLTTSQALEVSVHHYC